MTKQLTLFDGGTSTKNSSTFVNNMSIPVHRWFRYSAGFSAAWAESVIQESRATCVLDPFAGSGTTLLAADDVGVKSYGVESHPFVARIARAKLLRQSDPSEYHNLAKAVLGNAKTRSRSAHQYPDLITRCFHKEHLDALDRLRCAFEEFSDQSAGSELIWLTLVGILRATSHVGTAQWQYVLPNKTKANVKHPFDAFSEMANVFRRDMMRSQGRPSLCTFVESDARTCEGVPDRAVDFVLTSPPYPNNYDYADATRLEMMFFGEIQGWSDLQNSVRAHLVRSCSQHTTARNTDLESLLDSSEVEPIRDQLTGVCRQLAEVRKTKGGKKNYHLMVAAYFYDLSKTWAALRRTCVDSSVVCFVVGDSAPYGVYIPVAEWLGELAVFRGFRKSRFEKIRDRNVKWKNRKHRVPLCEGQLWVDG